MTVRYYVMPMAHGTDPQGYDLRYPAYIPEGVNYGVANYGSMDWCIVAADVATAQHNAITANSDVLSIPTNIESTLNTNAVNTAKTFLNSKNIPAEWITTGMTYHYVLKIIAGFFQYMQRTFGILGHDFDLPDGWPQLTMADIPVDIRDAMAQAADSFGYDYSWVTGSTTVRQLLKSMADDWGEKPIYLNVGTL